MDTERLQGMEAAREDLLERNYTDFEEQYRAYIRENTDFIFQDWQRYGELLALLESDRLAKAISRLKDRDRELLFAGGQHPAGRGPAGGDGTEAVREELWGDIQGMVPYHKGEKEAMTLTGLKKDSFYRLAKKYESERCL